MCFLSGDLCFLYSDKPTFFPDFANKALLKVEFTVLETENLLTKW